MAVKFEFYQTPKPQESAKKTYHARVINQQHVDSDQLAEEICHQCSLTEADIKAALVALSKQMAEHLKNGKRVHLDGIGYFQITLQCPETDNPKKLRAEDVTFKTVRFRADKSLKGNLTELKTKRSQEKPHSSAITEEKLETKLTEYFKTNRILTRRSFEEIFRLTRPTACRTIKKLVERQQLKNIGTSHSPVYIALPGNFGQ
ncbi:HU family DNA-binding protein [uncultured Bacteroides sp.]|uniref:HU family DNA-binding protein n=1 Tax=uncultured Bacteroides sp. TaxID=162156 RepID=UPI002613814D|nr:HU family DNA-binding protein [uncultured Bacteroides sp.]